MTSASFRTDLSVVALRFLDNLTLGKYVKLYLKSFIDSLWKGMGMYAHYFNTTEEYIVEEDLYNKFLKLTSPRNTECCNEDDINFITEYIKRRLETFVKYFVRKEDYRVEMLNGFDVGIYSYFVDKCENGESFYWFQNSRAIICQ